MFESFRESVFVHSWCEYLIFFLMGNFSNKQKNFE